MFPHRPSKTSSFPAPHPLTAFKMDIKMQCYGHRCVELTDTQFLRVGGFGVDLNGGHRRLDAASLIQLNGDSMAQTLLPGFEDSMYHSMTKISDNRFFCIGGRKSPKTTISKYGVWEFRENNLRPIFVRDSSNNNVSMEITSRWRHAAALFKGFVFFS